MNLVKIAQKTDIRRVATAVLCSMLAFGATGVLGSILPQDVLRIDGFASAREFRLAAPGKFYAVGRGGNADISSAVCAYEGFSQSDIGNFRTADASGGTTIAQDASPYHELKTEDRHFNVLGANLPSLSAFAVKYGVTIPSIPYEMRDVYVRKSLPERTAGDRLKIDTECLGPAMDELSVNSVICIVDSVLYSEEGLPLGVKFRKRALAKQTDTSEILCPVRAASSPFYWARSPMLGMETVKTLNRKVRSFDLGEHKDPAGV